jgi:hypothetical protein
VAVHGAQSRAERHLESAFEEGQTGGLGSGGVREAEHVFIQVTKIWSTEAARTIICYIRPIDHSLDGWMEDNLVHQNLEDGLDCIRKISGLQASYGRYSVSVLCSKYVL